MDACTSIKVVNVSSQLYLMVSFNVVYGFTYMLNIIYHLTKANNTSHSYIKINKNEIVHSKSDLTDEELNKT